MSQCVPQSRPLTWFCRLKSFLFLVESALGETTNILMYMHTQTWRLSFTNMGVWLVGATAQNFSFVQWLCMVLCEACVLASFAVPLLLVLSASWPLRIKRTPTSTSDLVKTSCARFWSSATSWPGTGGWQRSCSLHHGLSWRRTFGPLLRAHRVRVLADVDIISEDSRSSNVHHAGYRHFEPRPRSRISPGQSCRVWGSSVKHVEEVPTSSPSATQTSLGGRMDRRDARTRCADRGSQHCQSLSAYTLWWGHSAARCRDTHLRRSNRRRAGRMGLVAGVAFAAPTARWRIADTSAAEFGQLRWLGSQRRAAALALLRARAERRARCLGGGQTCGSRSESPPGLGDEPRRCSGQFPTARAQGCDGLVTRRDPKQLWRCCIRFTGWRSLLPPTITCGCNSPVSLRSGSVLGAQTLVANPGLAVQYDRLDVTNVASPGFDHPALGDDRTSCQAQPESPVFRGVTLRDRPRSVGGGGWQRHGRDRRNGGTNPETEPALSRIDRAQLRGGRQQEQEAGQRWGSRRDALRLLAIHAVSQ